jgi:hypothetical protein
MMSSFHSAHRRSAIYRASQSLGLPPQCAKGLPGAGTASTVGPPCGCQISAMTPIPVLHHRHPRADVASLGAASTQPTTRPSIR